MMILLVTVAGYMSHDDSGYVGGVIVDTWGAGLRAETETVLGHATSARSLARRHGIEGLKKFGWLAVGSDARARPAHRRARLSRSLWG